MRKIIQADRGILFRTFLWVHYHPNLPVGVRFLLPQTRGCSCYPYEAWISILILLRVEIKTPNTTHSTEALFISLHLALAL